MHLSPGVDLHYRGEPGSLSSTIGKPRIAFGPRSLVPPPMPPLPGSGPPPPPAEMIIDTPDVMNKVRGLECVHNLLLFSLFFFGGACWESVLQLHNMSILLTARDAACIHVICA